MARGANAKLAATMYKQLRVANNWSAADAWKGIAELLLTCEVQRTGSGWIPFIPKGATTPLDVIVYRESNDFAFKDGGPTPTIQKAEQLSQYLATQLGCSRANLCSTVAKFWRHPQVSQLQMHNLVGNAFRSIIVDALKDFGAPGITYEEEVHHKDAFPGWRFRSRSKLGKIDIFAWKGKQPVAMCSTRWRYRHDRVDFIHEAQAFSAAALEMFSGFPYYAVTGEFNSARLTKVLANAPSPIAAVVHFCPDLITHGLGENGRIAQLKGLDWLIQQTHTW
jgi:hypothetical protein